MKTRTVMTRSVFAPFGFFCITLAVLALAGLPARTFAQDIATTGSGHGYSTGYYASGSPDYTNGYSWGQTFRVVRANGPVLDNFSFWLSNHFGTYNPDDFTFRAYLMEWNGTSLTGPLLFSSAAQSPPPSQTFTEYSFATGGITLNVGSVYMAFVSMKEFPNPNPGEYTLGQVETAGTRYQPGKLYGYFPGDFDELTTGSDWFTFDTDAHFTADFSVPQGFDVSPEPVSMTLLGTGLAGIAAARRRRKKTV